MDWFLFFSITLIIMIGTAMDIYVMKTDYAKLERRYNYLHERLENLDRLTKLEETQHETKKKTDFISSYNHGGQ